MYIDMPGLEERPHSCVRHLTPPQRLEYDKALREREARREAAWEWFMNSSPACWSWTIPDDLEAWMPTIDADDLLIPEVAEALAAVYATPEGRGNQLLHFWQAGRCALCGNGRRDLVQDHDHETGLMRGLLCGSCNSREGIYTSDEGPFGRYRKRHPASILGLSIRYWDPIAKEYALPQPRRTEADKWIDAASEDIGL